MATDETKNAVLPEPGSLPGTSRPGTVPAGSGPFSQPNPNPDTPFPDPDDATIDIVSLSPPDGISGDTVIISGRGFGIDPHVPEVQFGRIRANVHNFDDTVITVQVPVQPADPSTGHTWTGPVDVKVTALHAGPGSTPAVVEKKDAFKYN